MTAGTPVRPARLADLTTVAALCQEHALYERASQATAPSSRALAAALAGSSPALHCWVAEHDGQLVGYASGSWAYCTWSASGYFLLDCLYLVASARSRGLGRELMAAVAEYARKNGASRIEWLTPDWNADAIGFYRRLEAVGSARMRFRLPL